MKQSIRSIFKSLSISLILSTILIGVLVILILEQQNSYKKISNLENQKVIISNLANLNKDDLELARIKLNGQGSQLHIEISKLRNLDKFDILGQTLGYSDMFLNNLDKLSTQISRFNKSAEISSAEM